MATPHGDGSHPAGQPGDIHRRQTNLLRAVAPENRPQHLTPPVAVRAQVWLYPAALAVTPLDSLETSTGIQRFFCVPSPNGLVVPPPALEPPHGSHGAGVPSPAVMAVIPLDSPETSTGVSIVVVPSPSWPK